MLHGATISVDARNGVHSQSLKAVRNVCVSERARAALCTAAAAAAAAARRTRHRASAPQPGAADYR